MAMPRACAVGHRPRVKSGMVSGMLPPATDFTESSIGLLHAGASWTTLSGVSPCLMPQRRRQFANRGSCDVHFVARETPPWSSLGENFFRPHKREFFDKKLAEKAKIRLTRPNSQLFVLAMGRTSDADERLKDAALALIWEESYGAVTIDDICNRAEVKKGSFYYFFDSKAELAVAALEKMWLTEWKPKLDQTFSSSVDPLTRLTTYLGGIYQMQLATKARLGKVLGCPVCSVGSETCSQENDLNAKVREILGRKRRYFEAVIRDALAENSIEPCDPAQKAAALIGLIEGMVGQARIMNDPEVLRNLPAMALELLRAKQSAPTAT